MPAFTLANLAVYVVHITALAVIGAGLARVLGMASPRARLFHYRVVLVAAICLPLAWSVASPTVSGAGPGRLQAAGFPAFGPGAGSPLAAPSGNASMATDLARSAGSAILGAIAAGLVARLVWVATGFRRLRRLRRRAAQLDPRPLPIREAVVLAAADADIRLSPEIGCPVNFGARHPTILLPRSVRAYPHDEQRAITCHELIHVRRRDWLRTVGDEIVRATFWFHPAIWWLLDELHLAREQVVDQEVVEITRSRRPYLEALVKLARPVPRSALRPASSFLRRAHLARRVTLLLNEVRMSKGRLLGALVASSSTVLIAGVVAAWVLPLQAAPAAERAKNDTSFRTPSPQASAPATPKQGPRPWTEQRLPRQTAKLLSRAAPVYPPDAKAQGIKGNVIVEARVDRAGHVTGVKVLRSVPGLDQAALDAVREWRFAPQQTESVYVATVRFDSEGEQRAKPKRTAPGYQPPPKIVARVEPVYPPEAKAQGIRGVVILEVRIDKTGQVTDVKILRSIPVLDQAAIDAVRQWRFEPQPNESVCVLTVPFDVDGKARKTPVVSPAGTKTRVKSPKVISSVKPEYPPDAKARGVQGNVILEIRVDADGNVTDVKVLRSVDAALDQAAAEAVRQWRYAPLTPARPFVATVTVRFDLK